MSNGDVKKNINKMQRVKKLEKKLHREQVRLSRRYECLKKQNRRKEKLLDKISINKSLKYNESIKP
ncbi:MAG: hypothetical protein ACRCWQ_12490 [Bacilli bacterium]